MGRPANRVVARVSGRCAAGTWPGPNARVDINGGLALVPASRRGGVPEWLKGADCKSAGVRLRWFESNPLHQPITY
jgi:hypothetical protein